MRIVVVGVLFVLAGCAQSSLKTGGDVGIPASAQGKSNAQQEDLANLQKQLSVQQQIIDELRTDRDKVNPVLPQNSVLNITPHIEVSRQVQGSTVDFWDDTYTRVRISSSSLGNEPESGGENGETVKKRDYEAERRSAIARFFAGKTVSANLTFKVNISGERPEFSATIPIVAMSHGSNKGSGETWLTDIYGQSVNKLIRVRAGSRINVSVELARSRSADSQVIQSALNVAREATKVISPASNVLTTLTKSSVDKEAQIWDSALSKLFALNLTERVLSDSLLYEFAPDSAIVSVELNLPKDLDEYSLIDWYKIGKWQLSLDCPTRSLFIPANKVGTDGQPITCQQQNQELPGSFKLAPERVLGYPLSENSTILSYLLSSTEFSDRIQDMAVAENGAPTAAAAKRLCGIVLEASEQLGLTRIDSNLVLWAVSQRFPITEKAADVQAACAQSKQTIAELMRLTP